MIQKRNFILICLAVMITMFLVGLLIGKIVYFIKEEVNKSICYNNLPVNEFYQEKKCSKYVEELLNE